MFGRAAVDSGEKKTYLTLPQTAITYNPYGATVFIIAQAMRISIIQYLVALLMHRLTGWDVTLCILLGGGITVESQIGRGSRFRFWVPTGHRL